MALSRRGKEIISVSSGRVPRSSFLIPARRGLYFQHNLKRDKILTSGMCFEPHLPAQTPLKRFRRGRHDRGR
jgi:hypothetical protein